MKSSLIALICVFAFAVCISVSAAFQDVSGNYGQTWLENYGSMPISTLESSNNLWNWGSVPKGYQLINGTVYPPGTAPVWYYPTSLLDYTPIIINKTESSSLGSASGFEADPWLLSQLTGRPVTVVHEPHSMLF